jgi:hypothetical protein
MSKTRCPHPVRRIRDALGQTSENSGLREFRTSEGFASLIERSASSVRNVESGSTKKWDRLARQIEKKTGVSAEWMLSTPDLSGPILDVRGNPWNPEEALDPLQGDDSGLNWRLLLEINPESVVRIVVKMVETRLSLDLVMRRNGTTPGSRGGNDFLRSLLHLIQESGSFADSEFVKSFAIASQEEQPILVEQMFRRKM